MVNLLDESYKAPAERSKTIEHPLNGDLHLHDELSTEENAVYADSSKQHWAVGVRGTASASDLMTDAKLVVLGSNSARHTRQEQLIEKILKHGPNTVHLAGHSLAGHLVRHMLHKHPDNKRLTGDTANALHHDEHRKDDRRHYDVALVGDPVSSGGELHGDDLAGIAVRSVLTRSHLPHTHHLEIVDSDFPKNDGRLSLAAHIHRVDTLRDALVNDMTRTEKRKTLSKEKIKELYAKYRHDDL